MTKTPYQDLEDRFRRMDALSGALNVLHWDMAAMMPPGGVAARTEQLATLKTLRHAMITDAALPDLLDAAEADAHLTPWQRANVAEMRRHWIHDAAIDADLVDALSRACAACETIWRKARADSDFPAVRGALQDVLTLTRRVGEAKAEALGLSPYDALLDQYEPGGRAADIQTVFDDLGAFLPDFLDDVLARQAAAPAVLPLDGPFAVDKQKALGRRMMETLGFDFDHGRLDESLHPCCGGVYDDVRITTRYDEADFTSALMGVLHETGHALYDQGLPKDWRGQPVGADRGMSIHESQSLLMEMQACRSREFLEFAAPVMRRTFGGSGPAWEVGNLARLYTRVERGFIRVDADEVTYPAHVILRFRLEQAAIAGDLKLTDLPGAWNDGMRELLGVVPPTDREGCLQDIHWFDGAWGYFPTYTLGAMTAAQMFSAAKRADPVIPDAIAKGDFTPLLAWLRASVHAKGCSLGVTDLLTEATGEPLNAAHFKAHLKRRYLDG
ncbi:MAG: carboxypeptidase M32 [Alphaproteobacteria bacterium]|nr:carboxypeptidase M32 [Alphaproteobacteria bacterium]